MKLKKLFLSLVVLTFTFCSTDNSTTIPPSEDEIKELTIFHINDQHGRINNFAKIPSGHKIYSLVILIFLSI